MSLNDKATAALTRELAKCFPERAANDPGHAKLAAALSDTAHTPGDWVAAVPNPACVADAPPYWIDADGYRVADVWHQGKRTAANARLIAAAPELLEALKALVSQCPAAPGTHLREVADNARAAIARATGGAA